ncbi:MAG TPA: exopolysaccharide Pel transporter PelG [Kofleriaceae bacterium]|nr:exopolysaccharide Pel transporter PelG [Kofleriaceae bacterium]
MAGIGWKLERMIDRDSLAGTVSAYLTGVALTSAPWLLTTTALVAMHALARGRAGDGDFAMVERIVTVTYAVTLVLSAPVHVVLSRYTADRLYERRPMAIAGSLRCALAATMLGFLAVGVFTIPFLGASFALACTVPMLAVLVGGQWLLLGVGGGLCSPAVVLRAFGAGTLVSIVGSVALDRAAGLGARGVLYGFAAGQTITLAGMLIGVLRALPGTEEVGPHTRLWPAFREYRLLAASAFLFHFSVWADKLVIWVLASKAQAVIYASAAALAWFSVIPAFAWIYVEIEIAFYRKFRDFYDAIEGGGSLCELEMAADELRRETARIVRGAAAIQLLVTALALAAGGRLVAVIGLPPEAVTPFRLVALGAAPQVVTLLGMLLLYYFDLRRESLLVAAAHLTVCVAGTAGAWVMDLPPGVGFATASVLSTVLVLRIADRRLQTLVVDTFQSQPYCAELLG